MKAKNQRSVVSFKKERQWGTEKNTTPLPIMHDTPSASKLTWSRIAIVLTIVFWLLYIFSIVIRQLIDTPLGYGFTMEAFGYAFVVTVLTFSSLMYLIARHGALESFSKHKRAPRALIDSYFAKDQPGITILIPSYKEEVSVIRKTLLSAALQEYPNLKIVLLLDDNPNPADPIEAQKLDETRKLGQKISQELKEPYAFFQKSLKSFEKSNAKKRYVSHHDTKILAKNYQWAVNWIENFASKENIEDHVDIFFKNQVLLGLAKDLDITRKALENSISEVAKLPKERVRQLYLHLMWIFDAKFEVFERKKFVSLSHEANKAMNLNSYIGLMGKNYRIDNTPEGKLLLPTKKVNGRNILQVPDSDFVLTLDADSILLREYCLRLVYFLNQPENKNVAVAQTPYSSFRGALTRIERLAGATTDVQHILHQGMSWYGGAFWVGANAVIRKKALEDIAETYWEKGFKVKRYIQDRTVIEDTESSIDLGVHGWRIANYPERLSYSATPPDFGSLIVQRRRWANGGLLILPKLFKKGKTERQASRIEMFLRINYMASIAWSTLGLIFLLAYPYDGRLLSPLVLLSAVPYFIAMSSDLKYNGYRYSDIFRIYGFNLIMLPVNLAGVLKSIEQALTDKKIPFARTPKVKDRTRASTQYVILPILIVAFSVFTVYRNIIVENWGNAIFAGFNSILASWAIISYIGVRDLVTDVWYGLTDWLYVERKDIKSQNVGLQTSSNSWKSIIYHGASGYEK